MVVVDTVAELEGGTDLCCCFSGFRLVICCLQFYIIYVLSVRVLVNDIMNAGFA